MIKDKKTEIRNIKKEIRVAEKEYYISGNDISYEYLLILNNRLKRIQYGSK